MKGERNLHSENIAILWSANPIEYGLLGSPMTHMGFLESYPSVVWELCFPEANLEQFKFPMSGYIYTTDTGSVKFRARIIDMKHGFPAEFRDSMPPWRALETHTRDLADYISILIDQLNPMHPDRGLDEFVKLDDTPVEVPPQAKYTLVKDPLY